VTATALTIAGSDSGGGAGIQADLKTFSALETYGLSVITAITAQNTRGVFAVEDVSSGVVAAQIKAVFEDFNATPLTIGALKIGMVSRVETIETIAAGLVGYEGPVVVDPVMVATSGDRLLQEDAVSALRERLLPLATLATPNLPEAALLTGLPLAEDRAAVTRQAEAILKAGASAVLIKGGHGDGLDSTDLLFDGDRMRVFWATRIATRNDHGTGCTLAAAITAHLARGYGLVEAVSLSKTYLHQALDAGRALRVGHGRGPVHHFHRWWPA
jgi:hydroxymethylpyrimidine/phosphomethylpyrimidine kinase